MSTVTVTRHSYLAVKILLVEDDTDLRTVVRLTLETAERQVLEAGDGCEALEMAAAEHPDLVVLDWLLPGMSGLEVAQALRDNAETHDIRIIMLTSRDQQELVEAAHQVGISAYLIKPFSPLQLVESVERAT